MLATLHTLSQQMVSSLGSDVKGAVSRGFCSRLAKTLLLQHHEENIK